MRELRCAGKARGLRSRGLSRPGRREIAGTLSQLQAGRQAGNGMACSRAKARLNWVSQGQRRGRCKVRRARRAGDPSHQSEDPPPEGLGDHGPLAQTNPRRPSQAPLAAKRADGMWFQPDAVLEVAYGRSRPRRGGDDRPPVPASPHRMGVQSSSGIASIRSRRLARWRMVIEKRTSISRQAATTVWA